MPDRWQGTLLGRTLRFGGVTTAARLVTSVFALLQVMLLTRTLGPAGYGELSLAMAVVLTAHQVGNARVWEGLSSLLPNEAKRDEAGGVNAVVTAAFAIEGVTAVVSLGCVWGGAIIAGRWYGVDFELLGTIAVYALVILVRIPREVAGAILRFDDKYRTLAATEAAAACLKLLLVWVALLVWASVETIAVALVLGEGLHSGLMSERAFRCLGRKSWADWRVGSGELWSAAKKLAGYVFTSNLVGTFRALTNRLDVLVLGALVGRQELGLFALARDIVQKGWGLVEPWYALTFTELGKSIKLGSGQQTRGAVRAYTGLGVSMGVSVVLVTWGLAPWIVPLVFGEAFTSSVGYLQILAISFISLGVLWFPGWLFGNGFLRTYAVQNAAFAAVYVSLLLILVYGANLGATGAAVAEAGKHVFWLLSSCLLYLGFSRHWPRHAS